jgi:hypothetical protein
VSEDSAPFPVSRHGVLSRRASEKDSLHRIAAADMHVVPENASDAPLGPSDPPRIPTRWCSLVISQIADTTCKRGAWNVAGSRAVGLQRRSRKPPDSGTNRTVIDTFLTPFSFSPSCDSAIDSLPDLFLAYCTLQVSEYEACYDSNSDTRRVPDSAFGHDSDPVPLITH